MFTDLSGTQLIANYVLFDGPGLVQRRRATQSGNGGPTTIFHPQCGNLEKCAPLNFGHNFHRQFSVSA
jgi:hypothetical protein